ncbi:Twinfilin-1 [Coemansia sp. RSA 2704]|nr:Twinfilin-1 [Coemansia sp. RSA 2704]
MSSLTSGIAATPELKRFFDEARAGQHREVAVLRVQIRGDDLAETGRKQGTADGDLTQLDEYLDDRVSFLVLRASATSWYVVMWMPEGKVGVSSRMVYAASQSKLKEAVGEGCVQAVLQFSTREEALGGDAAPAADFEATQVQSDAALAANGAAAVPETAIAAPRPAVAPKPTGLAASRSFTKTTTVTHTIEYERTEQRIEQRASQQASERVSAPAVAPKPAGVFVKKIDPRLAMSRTELEHVNMLQQEDAAREEQLHQMQTRLRENPHANTSGLKQTEAAVSGGFHSVELPLTLAAKEALSGFASNVGTTVVELHISGGQVDSSRSFASTEDFAPTACEPRFYVMRTPGSRAFVYACPEASPPRQRMVYSTAGAATLNQIQRLGCRITHRLSLFSPRECTLVAVAATIRNGQAQRVGDDKPVDAVVNFRPAAPARSLPSRFVPSSSRALDAFTDEGGFRKAFSTVRPDAPAPAPFRSPATEPSPYRSVASDATHSDAVDSAPNSGAAAWGVQLKSSARSSASHSASNVATLTTRFSQTQLAGEAGDDSPAASNKSSPVTEFADVKPDIVRSSMPGLRPVPNARSSAPPSGDKWDPWRPVNASNGAAANEDVAPKSALQSSVYASSGGPAPGSIADFMNDISYPPLQNTASRGNPEVR